MKNFLFSILILCNSVPAFSVSATPTPQCPEWMSDRSRMPLCPATGLVPETYPVAAVIVSDEAYIASPDNYAETGTESLFTADVVTKTLMGAGENLPLMILPVTDATMEMIRAKIRSLSISETRKKSFLTTLHQVPVKSYTWQQDFMQGVVNPQTGQLSLREVAGYTDNRKLPPGYFRSIADVAAACGLVTPGPPLVPKGGLENGHMGGNIETLPGGICMLGDDHMTADSWEDYRAQVCPGGDTINVPTKWLSVGHTDEIVKVVRDNRKQAPCDFSVVLASPRKARDLLRQNPDQKFLDFTGGRAGTPAALAARRTGEYDGLVQLCAKVQEYRENPATDPSPDSEPGGSSVNSVSQFKLQLFLGSKAIAQDIGGCDGMTNKEVLRALENGSLGRYNDIVQGKMDRLKTEMQARLADKLPQCSVDFMDTPDAFFGGEPVQKPDGSYDLPKEMGLSILPNPTNGISVNNTVITPEPGNKSFKDYIEAEYKKRGLDPQFVDTFD